VEAVHFAEADLPILCTPIHRAEFPIQPEEDLHFLMSEITAETTEEEIQTIAREWLRELEFHLSES
jgi:hypothetical protein